MPDLPGIAHARPWTNRAATDSHDIPRRLAVVGAGPVGVEMATAWHGLGSTVTLLSRTRRLLPRMEPFVGDLVADGLRAAGVAVRTGVGVSELRRATPADPVMLILDDDSTIEADQVLFATGRPPNTDDIGLATVGLTVGQAERAGHRIRAVDVDFGAKVMGANLYADGYTGRARMVVDLDRQHLLGVTFVGPGVAELLTSATVAVVGQVPVDRLWHAVPCFPTISEIWLRLLGANRG